MCTLPLIAAVPMIQETIRATYPRWQRRKGCPQNQPRPPRAGAAIVVADVASATAQLMAFGQVFLIQSAAAVDSLWPWPGFGQFAGAVMLRIGMVMIRLGSQVGNGYSALFLLNPVTASL